MNCDDASAICSRNEVKSFALLQVNLDDILNELEHHGINLNSARKVNAKLPFLLSPDKDKIQHGITAVKERNGVWLNEWLVTSGVTRSTHSENDTCGPARDSILASIYMVPQGDPNSELMKNFAKFFIIGLLTDDMVEGTNILERNEKIVLVLPELISELIHGRYESFENIPCPYPVLTPLMRGLFFATKETRPHLPNFDHRIRHFVSAILNTLSSMCYVQQYKKDLEEMVCSEDTLLYFRRFEIGYEPFIELAAVFLGIEIEEEVRNSLLFRRVMDLVGRIGALTNDLVGIKKDIKDRCPSSVLLMCRQQKMSLDVAFEKAANRIQTDTQDLEFTCRKLEEIFEPSENVSNFVLIVKQFVDGYIHWSSAGINRYGPDSTTITITYA